MSKVAIALAAGSTIAEIAAGFAPIPGLVPAVELLCSIIERCQKVEANRHAVRQLAKRCDQFLEDITTGANIWTPDFIHEAVQETEQLLEDIKCKMTVWANKGRVKCFLKQKEIEDDVEDSNKAIDTCYERFQLASHLKIHQWQSEFAYNRKCDQDEVLEYLAEIRNWQSIQLAAQEDQGRLMRDLMQMMQTLLSAVEQRDRRHVGLQRNLHHLQSNSGDLLPNMELKAGEVRRIGRNAVGGTAGMDVWEGIYLDEEKVAIKMIRAVHTDEKNIGRFRREMLVWARLWEVDRGKYILPFYGFCQTDGPYPYVVSPWQENGKAINYVKKHPFIDRRKLVLRVAHGVRVLHTMQPPVVHGDLRAANILINASGNPCISDFGLSKVVEDISGAPLTQSRGVSDLCRWFAPELLMGQAVLTTSTDIYALGMTILELMTALQPFKEIRSNTEVVIRVNGGAKPQRPQDPEVSNRGLRDDLWELLMRCWDTEPTRRPSIGQIIVELEAMWPSVSVA